VGEGLVEVVPGPVTALPGHGCWAPAEREAADLGTPGAPIRNAVSEQHKNGLLPVSGYEQIQRSRTSRNAGS
jgi:hypothetical protein